MTLQGLPAANTSDGISLVTTLPAPIAGREISDGTICGVTVYSRYKFQADGDGNTFHPEIRQFKGNASLVDGKPVDASVKTK